MGNGANLNPKSIDHSRVGRIGRTEKKGALLTEGEFLLRQTGRGGIRTVVAPQEATLSAQVREAYRNGTRIQDLPLPLEGEGDTVLYAGVRIKNYIKNRENIYQFVLHTDSQIKNYVKN